MKKAIKGLSLAMGIASMTANVGAMLWKEHEPFSTGEEISVVIAKEINKSIQSDKSISSENQKDELEKRTADILSQLKDIAQDTLDQITEVIAFPRTVVFFLGKRESFICKKYKEKVLSEKEMKEWNISNVPNGLLGMNRDVNMLLTTFFKDNSALREIFCVDHIFFEWKDHFLFEEQMVARFDRIYNTVNDYNGREFNIHYVIKNGLFYIPIDLLFRRGTSHESLFDLFLRSVCDSRRYIVHRIFCDSLMGELMRLNGDPKALGASLVFNARKNGYSLVPLKESYLKHWLKGHFGLDITTVQQSSSSSSSSSSTAMGVLNLSSSSDSIGHQSLLDKFKSIDLPYDDAIATSSSSKSTPEGSVCSSSNESSISSTKEQKRKFMVESIIALLREQDNSEDTLYVYLIKNNLSCLPLRVWLELDLITEVFLEGNDDFEAFRRMLLSTIDRLFLENCHDPRRVANILETTRDGRGRNLIDIIIQYAKIDRVSADFVLSETLVKKYEIPFSGETLKKIKVVAI